MAAHNLELAQHLSEFGINIKEVTYDFGQFRNERQDRFKELQRREVPDEDRTKSRYSCNRQVGTARQVEVTGADGTKERISTKNIIIATGSVVVNTRFETDGVRVVNSDHILS